MSSRVHFSVVVTCFLSLAAMSAHGAEITSFAESSPLPAATNINWSMHMSVWTPWPGSDDGSAGYYLAPDTEPVLTVSAVATNWKVRIIGMRFISWNTSGRGTSRLCIKDGTGATVYAWEQFAPTSGEYIFTFTNVEAHRLEVYVEGVGGDSWPGSNTGLDWARFLEITPGGTPVTNEVSGPFTAQALNESCVPIRPGEPGITPFWNTRPPFSYIYAPAFDMPAVGAATNYRFTLQLCLGTYWQPPILSALTFATNGPVVFEAPHPWSPLSPAWRDLQPGLYFLRVQGLDSGGSPIGDSGSNTFFRAVPFDGPYHEQARDYTEAARMVFEYMMAGPYYQQFKDPSGGIDHDLYPGAFITTVINSMYDYINLKPTPGNADEALQIATNAGNYLLTIRYSAATRLEGFPYVYSPDHPETAAQFDDPLIVYVPAYAADAFMDLYALTGRTNYLDAAKRIADTYLALQLPSGSWPVKANITNALEDSEHEVIGIYQVRMVDRFASELGVTNYAAMRDAAFQWIFDNPVATWMWEAQFEDTGEHAAYHNLSGFGATMVAEYLFERWKENSGYAPLAEEILRWVEDQFIFWERPFVTGLPWMDGLGSAGWLTPCHLEQYEFYVAVNASVADSMNAYLDGYRATHKPIYLVKASSRWPTR